jgi:hypothetical protein
MRWGFLARVLLGVALVVGVIALGTGIYQAGFSAGAATEGTATPVPAYGYGYGWGWHGGFGFFGFFGFLLFLFVLFALIRAIAWGGPGRWGRRGWGPGYGRGYGPRGGSDHEHGRFGPWEGRAQEAFDDSHRQAHEGTTPPADRDAPAPPPAR